MTIEKPLASEFNQFYSNYISKVPEVGPYVLMKDQIRPFEKLRALSDKDAGYRYAEGKWTVRELLGHVCDTERLFTYRLLHIARGDQAPLAGMDEKAWNATAAHNGRRLQDIGDEMVAVRRATVKLVESLDPSALTRTGTANSYPISARALVWIIPGHAQHHINVLRERYGIGI
jgi:uncharacterized damage-inducible protein DinB